MNTHVPNAPGLSTSADSTCRLDELGGLSNEDLLASTKQLVGASNQVLAALLAHLAEVQARGLHRERACASLYTYCLYELRLSEDAAFRRAKAARIVRDFPKLLGAIARGELHLTGLLMLGPHLTDDNLDEVLARAKHRSKREIAALVRRLDPLPDVPPRIEPLGPAPARVVSSSNPAWADVANVLAGPVRDLEPGERPADWMPSELATTEVPAPARDEPADGEPPASLEPQRYKVQFTASEEYVALLEQARDLLSHAAPNASLDEIHVRALRALVAELQKKKYAATDRPREPRPANSGGARDARGRYVPAAVRRTVAKRDGGRCTYVDPVTGKRCRETRRLELHHEHAHALGGAPTTKNLTLRCAAHNALAAEQDFGREFMLDKVGAGAEDPRRRGDDPRWSGDDPRWTRFVTPEGVSGDGESARGEDAGCSAVPGVSATAAAPTRAANGEPD